MAEKTTKEIGDNLEVEVANIYEALGYQVKRGPRIGGHQVDLLAERYMAGAGNIRIAVEVKARASGLGVNDLNRPLDKARNLLSARHVTNIVFVTDIKIHPNAREAVETLAGATVVTVAELEHLLFNNAAALSRVIADREEEDIFQAYYALRGRIQGTIIEDAAFYILEWARNARGILLLTGDFGSGKSTIVERVLYYAAKERQRKRDYRFPVLLRLKHMRRYKDLWSFIEDSLRQDQYLSPPRLVFEGELRRGRLLILLDGFDEIFTGATADDRASYLDELRPLLMSPSPCLLATRPTFFESFDDMMFALQRLAQSQPEVKRVANSGVNRKRLAELMGGIKHPVTASDLGNVLELLQLDKTQIFEAILAQETSIRAKAHISAQEFQALLYRIYDLEDLMRRPLLLDLIIRTVTSGAIDLVESKVVGPATLYEIYTQQAVYRDTTKISEGQFLESEPRLEACRAMAFAMLRKGAIHLTASEVAACAAEVAATMHLYKPFDDPALIARAFTDIRTCAFLHFAEDGSLTFAHRSYFEFFVAQKIYLSIQQSLNAFIGFAEYKIDRAILYFLGSYAREQEELTRFIRLRMKENPVGKARDFIYRLAFSAGAPLIDGSFMKGVIADAELVRATIERLSMDTVDLVSCAILNVEAKQWTWRNVLLSTLTIRTLKADKCEFALGGSGLEIYDSCFTNSVLALPPGDTRIESCDFVGCHLDFFGPVHLLATRFEACDIHIAARARISAGGRLNCEGGSLTCAGADEFYSKGFKLTARDMLLLGPTFHASDLLYNFKQRTNGAIELTACRGILLLIFSEEMLNSEAMARFVKANPGLAVIDSRLLGDDITKLDTDNAMVARVIEQRSARLVQTLTRVTQAMSASQLHQERLPAHIRSFLAQHR